MVVIYMHSIIFVIHMQMTSPSTESLACKLEEKLKNVTLRQSAQLAMIKTHIAKQLKRGETVRAKKLDAEECRMKVRNRAFYGGSLLPINCRSCKEMLKTEWQGLHPIVIVTWR